MPIQIFYTLYFFRHIPKTAAEQLLKTNKKTLKLLKKQSKTDSYGHEELDQGNTHSANQIVVFQWSIFNRMKIHEVVGAFKRREIVG